MLTDPSPRRYRAQFLDSDRLTTLDLPTDNRLPSIAARIERAMRTENVPAVRRACAEFLEVASGFYDVELCGVRVLAARPLRVYDRGSFELFGDYDPRSAIIRVWLRTAIRKDITSYGTFLSTLCHEFCHHLDFQLFGFADSWHTRGFYERAGVLYHHARGTPLKQLYWIPLPGNRWRIDWQRTTRRAS
jgi:hypothetical protein